MNCSEVQELLTSLLYGDLKPKESAPLEQHLAACSSCRNEYAALKHVHRLLDAGPAPPEVQVHLPTLYRQLAEMQQKRLQRWRRAAIAISGIAAAVLFIAVAVRLEVRMEQHQVVVRWGTPPPDTRPQAEQIVMATPEPQPARNGAEQLRLITDLIHALAEDIEQIDERGSRQQQHLARLQARVLELQQLADRRWTDTERTFAGLYLLSKKGENP